MTSCFPVVVGKSCLRLRKCSWHCLSRPIVGTLMMEGKYSFFYKYIYIVKNVFIALKYFPDLDVMYLPNTPLQRWEFADSRLVRSVGSSGTCSKQTRTASNKLQLVLGSLELHWNKKYSITIFNLIANDIKTHEDISDEFKKKH